MNKYWTKFSTSINARKQEERVLVLAAALVVIAYLGFVFLIEPLQTDKANVERRISVANAQILEQSNQQAEINATFTSDPNTFARRRQAELQEANAVADRELLELNGKLINPDEMSLMLTRVLQRETSLKLVTLNNKPSELLFTSATNDGTSLEGQRRSIQVFRHGLQMVFEGSYIETINYLRSLEELESNFFWENMSYTVTEYPNARILLDVYTLSTQRGWIGV